MKKKKDIFIELKSEKNDLLPIADNGTEDPICIVVLGPDGKNIILEVCNYDNVNHIVLDQVKEFVEEYPCDSDFYGFDDMIYKMELTINGSVDWEGECETWLEIKSYQKYTLEPNGEMVKCNG